LSAAAGRSKGLRVAATRTTHPPPRERVQEAAKVSWEHAEKEARATGCFPALSDREDWLPGAVVEPPAAQVGVEGARLETRLREP
jgi:hypothetical protein